MLTGEIQYFINQSVCLFGVSSKLGFLFVFGLINNGRYSFQGSKVNKKIDDKTDEIGMNCGIFLRRVALTLSKKEIYLNQYESKCF